MRRFDFEENNDENKDDVDKFFDENEDEVSDVQIELSFAYRDLNQKLLSNVIQVCQKSLFWRFYSLTTRLMMIRVAYENLKKLEEE